MIITPLGAKTFQTMAARHDIDAYIETMNEMLGIDDDDDDDSEQ